MGFVSILPFLMVFSLYSLSSLMTLTMVFFGLNMFYLMWGIAFWVDNHLTTALSQGYSLGAGIFTAATNPTQTVIIMWVQRFMYLILPMFWMTSLGWVGFKGIHMAGDGSRSLGEGSGKLGEGAGKAGFSAGKSGAGKAMGASMGAYSANKERKAQIQSEMYLTKADRGKKNS